MKNFLYKTISTSSVIRTLIYDVRHNFLAVHFKSGTVWIYKQVPLEIYDGLCSAQSVGSFFNSHIRNLYESEQFMTASEWAAEKEKVFDASQEE